MISQKTKESLHEIDVFRGQQKKILPKQQFSLERLKILKQNHDFQRKTKEN